MKHKSIIALAIFVSPILVWAAVDPSSVTQRRAQLETQLQEYERQIAETENIVLQKRKESDSLQRDIAILDGNIKLKKLAIKAHTLAITKLDEQITQKSQAIQSMAETIAKNKVSLSELLRQVNERDNQSAVELALEFNNVVHFFDEIESSRRLQDAVQDSVKNLTGLKTQEETARTELEDDKEQEQGLRTLQELEKKSIEGQEREKQQILKVTKGKESEYQKVLSNKQKEAANIRSQLFLLQGSPSISFEKAIEYANLASRLTGVRPAFILGIIAQESDLGRNVGQCNLPDDPPSDHWQAVMKPTRDHAPYLAITRDLGLDPERMPVSCPLRGRNGARIGWGGAMGPAQFIPSTWVLYVKKVGDLTGHKPPNPWDPQDAFVASGLLSKDNGAVGTRENERKAAAKYFAGGNWNTSLGRSYASQVLAKVDKFQEQIDLLQSLAQQ